MEKSLLSSEKRSRRFYIAEAALEYLIAILVAGSFLATLTKELGFSDSLTGILSSFISLGCLFQLLSVALRPKKVKGVVIGLSVANQLLFMMLYVVPVFPVDRNVKIGLFILFIFAAYLLYYIAHPKKVNWLMSLAADGNRGSFTANKEIVSLISGMVFSFVMGSVSDHYAAIGKSRTAFVIMAVVIFTLTVAHTLSMVFTVEKQVAQTHTESLLHSMKAVLQNKKVLRITLVFVMYHIAIGVCTPFYGTYQISELAFSLQFVSLLTILSGVARIFVSRFWGKYADKRSFAAMMEKCLGIMVLAFLCAAMAVPANGKLMFILYYIFYGIAMGGVNSALTNLVFDYVPQAKRADSLAVCQAVSGVAGFLTTLAASGLVEFIQQNGNCLWGVPIYAQQVVSVAGAGLLLLTILCVRKVGRTNE